MLRVIRWASRILLSLMIGVGLIGGISVLSPSTRARLEKLKVPYIEEQDSG